MTYDGFVSSAIRQPSILHRRCIYYTRNSCTTNQREYPNTTYVVHTTFIKDDFPRIPLLRSCLPDSVSKQQDTRNARLPALHYQAVQSHKVYASTFISVVHGGTDVK